MPTVECWYSWSRSLHLNIHWGHFFCLIHSFGDCWVPTIRVLIDCKQNFPASDWLFGLCKRHFPWYKNKDYINVLINKKRRSLISISTILKFSVQLRENRDIQNQEIKQILRKIYVMAGSSGLSWLIITVYL